MLWEKLSLMTTSRGAPQQSRLPKVWQDELERVLIGEDQLQQRVAALAAEIESAYHGRELVIVALLNGTIMFLADLIRHLELPLRLDFIGVSSYGNKTTPGELVFTKELRLDVNGRDVLVVDDILDTGRTLNKVLSKLQKLSPRSLSVCVLLEKKARRRLDVHADYVGFEIEDLFVVGYGLDFAERFRNLPFVGVLQKHVYAKPE
jgi:hypoxanthine phosphoribosyltransferase